MQRRLTDYHTQTNYYVPINVKGVGPKEGGKVVGGEEGVGGTCPHPPPPRV